MAAPASAAEFLGLLRKSGLIEEDALARYLESHRSLGGGPQECASSLVRSGLLTAFQAKNLMAGRYRGLVLGPYKLLQPLGQGGMGVVYLAEHTSLKRKVAVKVLPHDKATERLSLERFYREARAAAALDHPNIVRLHDVSQGAGVHFLVMEYVEGMTLQALIDTAGPLHFVQAVEYAAQAAAGLQHAHEKGFVHRDIKPANLILLKDGSVKILDMGLARSFENAEDNLTGKLGEGEVAGTADFLSPEQALNLPTDSRSDIYSLGMTLFTLLTAQVPFQGTTAQKLLKHQMHTLPRLSSLRATVPAALSDVVERMAAKQPEDRYQTAAEVIDALTPWLPAAAPRPENVAGKRLTEGDLPASSGQPSRAGRKSRRKLRKVERRARLARRRGILVAAVGVALLAALGGWVAIGMSRPAPVTAQSTSAVEPPVTTTPTATFQPAAQETLARSTTAPTELPWTGPKPLQSQRALTGLAKKVNDVVFSPDGRKAAGVDWNGMVVIWDTATGDPRYTIAGDPMAAGGGLATTPDGRYLLAANHSMPVRMISWETGSVVREFPSHAVAPGGCWGVAAAPNNREFATCGDTEYALVRDLETGDEVRRYDAKAKLWCVAFSPDGSMIAASVNAALGSRESPTYPIILWDKASGQELRRFVGHTRAARWVSFSRDGTALVTAGFDGTVRVWETATGNQIQTIEAHHNGVAERAQFLPGGKYVLSCGGPMGDPNGARQTNSSLSIWEVATGRKVFTGDGGHEKGMIGMAVSRDGRFALTGSRDMTARVWELPPGLTR